MLRMNIAKDWHDTIQITKKNKLRQVYYFSMEFLMGRMITNNLMNSGVYPIVKQAFTELGLDLNEVEHQETDAGLGNGGLGLSMRSFAASVCMTMVVMECPAVSWMSFAMRWRSSSTVTSCRCP